MHIGFITSEYPHPKVKNAAGIGTSIKNLAIALIKKGVSVTVFVYHQEKDIVLEDLGVSIHLISKKQYRFATWYFYRKHLNNYINTVSKKQDIDILEVPDWTGITAFMKFEKPLIIRFHGSDAYFCQLEGRKQKWKNYLFEKQALKRADGFIAPTNFAAVQTANIFNLDKNKIYTIHYGLELSKFINENPNEYKRKTILYLGTIIRKKGVLELAKIFNKVVNDNPNAKLIFIGSDSRDIKTGELSTIKMVLELLSPKAKNNFEYLGKVPYNSVQDHIKNAHVCVFPSFAETLGMVTIESMALQKPVINTNIGWGNELIDDNVNGYLLHPEDINGYSKRIISLFKDEERCMLIGIRARKQVEKLFDIDKNAEINIEYYKEFI